MWGELRQSRERRLTIFYHLVVFDAVDSTDALYPSMLLKTLRIKCIQTILFCSV